MSMRSSIAVPRPSGLVGRGSVDGRCDVHKAVEITLQGWWWLYKAHAPCKATTSLVYKARVDRRPPGTRGGGGILEAGQDVVDAGGQGAHVGRVDGGEHADAELVAAELAVGLGVDDAVGAQ